VVRKEGRKDNTEGQNTTVTRKGKIPRKNTKEGRILRKEEYQGRKEGRKEGRPDGQKEGRKEGRKDGDEERRGEHGTQEDKTMKIKKKTKMKEPNLSLTPRPSLEKCHIEI
jgi:hypothetical protein